MAPDRKNLSEMNTAGFARSFSYGTVVYPPGGRLGPRRQPCLQIVLLHRGSARIWVDDRERQLAAGEMTLLLPGTREQFEFAREEETHHTWIHGERPELDSETRHWLSRAPEVLPISSRMEQLMALGLGTRRATEGEALKREIGQQLGPTLFLEYLRAGGVEPPDEHRHPTPLRQALKIMAEEFATPLDLPTIAQRSGVSPQHLMRLFRTHTGVTPIRHLWQVRVREAEKLIAETGLSLTEIAERTGYQNTFHLSRHIRQRCGQSPKQLRSTRWREN